MPSYKLLSQSSYKIDKGNKIQDKYFSRVLYLAPDDLADGKRTLCPYAKIAKCSEACLNTAGMGKFSNVQQARIRKSLLFLNDQKEFLKLLVADVHKFLKECEKLGKLPALRLNGTSDIQWETIEIEDGKNIFEMFPQIQWYDYTKIPTRKVDHIPNYHLTWSYSEANDKYAKLFDKVPNNKAVVFNNFLPKVFKGLKVIDGDTHDMRFLDDSNVVVGLLAKANAKKDTTGFVINTIKI
jgi:hypothetical protein|tara:strand:+ start:279 stop:995 length:717 start_codon:yes stop_codon:yes gene_type:complete